MDLTSYTLSKKYTDSQLAENATSITSKGAKSDGSNSLTPILDTITSNKEIIIPSGIFTISNELSINTPANIQGKKGSQITNTNTAASGDMKINSDDVTLESITLDGKSTIQGMYTGSVKRFKLRKSKLIAAKHGIHINSANVEDIEIMNSDISADSFGVLTNGNAKNGKNINILFNKIYSKKSDAIELNNPSDSNTDTWKQAKVIGNTIIADEYGTGNGSGFAVGIAKTRDVIVLGNIIEKSRREALHIEDDQENVIVTGNVFNGCMADGARIMKGGLTGTGKAKPVIVTNNHFIKYGITKTDAGIWRTFDGSGSLESNLSNNYISGFDIGLWLDGRASSNITGCIIEDCNIAIKAGERSVLTGSVLSMNCPILIQGNAGSTIDKVLSKIKPTTVLQYTGTVGNAGATLKGFSIQNTVTSANGASNTIDLFPLPSIMQGKLTLKNGDSNKIWFTCDLSWDGTTLTITNLMKKTGGLMGSTVTVINNSGQLAFTIFTAASFTTTLIYDFDGVYYQE